MKTNVIFQPGGGFLTVITAALGGQGSLVVQGHPLVTL